MTTNPADVARIRKIAADAGYELTKRHGKDQFTLTSLDPALLQRESDAYDAWSDAFDADSDDEPALSAALEKLSEERYPVHYRPFAEVQKWLVDHHPECIPAPAPDPHPLRAELEECVEENGGNMSDYLVMSRQSDPFFMDTPAHRADAQVVADAIRTLGIEPTHDRGHHYQMLGAFRMPDGTLYGSKKKKPKAKDDPNWVWLVAALGYARWLNYIDFEQVTDRRNDAPLILERTEVTPWGYAEVDPEITVPDEDDLLPRAGIANFDPLQPYRIALVGEKSSLRTVLVDLSNKCGTDLLLPTGDISNTQIYKLAKAAAEDGRPLIVLYFSDCDPSGWFMPAIFAHKLRALRSTHFPGLQYRVFRAALTPRQVRELRAQGITLPESPVKESDQRADDWTARMRVGQIELDALLTPAMLRRGIMRGLAEKALNLFYDPTLDARVRAAADPWEAEVLAAIEEQMPDHAERRRAAAERLDEIREEIDEIVAGLSVEEVELPELPELPEAEIDESLQPLPLCDSADSFADHAERLIQSRAFQLDDELDTP